MKLRVARKELLAAAKAACRTAPKKHHTPVITHVLIDATDDPVRIIATDLEQYTIEHLNDGVVTLHTGAVCVPAADLLDWLTGTSGDIVELDAMTAGEMTVTTDDGAYTMPTTPADDYPDNEHSGLPVLVGVTLAAPDLLRALQAVAPCMTRDEGYALSGARISIDAAAGRPLTIVATDTHRMSICDLPASGRTTTARDAAAVIMPRSTVDELIKRLKGERGEIEMYIHEHTMTGGQCIRVIAQGWTLYSSVIEGTYPDYEQFRKLDRGPSEIELRGNELTKTLKRALKIANKDTPAVRLDPTGDTLTITVNNGAKRASLSTTCAVVTGGGAEAYNARFLIDMLAALPSEAVAHYGPGAPLVVCVDGLLYIVSDVSDKEGGE